MEPQTTQERHLRSGEVGVAGEEGGCIVTEKSAVAKKDHAVSLQDLRLAPSVPSLRRHAPARRSGT